MNSIQQQSPSITKRGRKGTPVRSIPKTESSGTDSENDIAGPVGFAFSSISRRIQATGPLPSEIAARQARQIFTHGPFGWIPQSIQDERIGNGGDGGISSPGNQSPIPSDIHVSSMATATRNILEQQAGNRPSLRAVPSAATPRARLSADRQLLTPSFSDNSPASATTFSLQIPVPSSSLIKKAKKSKPLDISKEPGVELLDEEEYTLCTTLRITPSTYFEGKEALVSHGQIKGFYKKSAAQRLMHIDVNKTGKLYDFFFARGWLPYPPSPENNN